MKKLIFILCLIFVSCSPQKRLTNLLNRHPKLMKNDTIYVVDTIITKEYKNDTISFFKNDTLIIETERYKLQIIKGINDTIRTGLIIKSDTIFNKRQEIITKYRTIEKNNNNKWLFFVILIFVVLWLIKLKK